jgi:hypothetical protein
MTRAAAADLMALEQALRVPLQDEFAARFALDRFIWSGKAAAPARRSYLSSHTAACIAFFGNDRARRRQCQLSPWIFAGISAAAVVVTLRARRRFRTCRTI